MLNSLVIDQMNLLRVNQRIDLLQYSCKQLTEAQIELLTQYYWLNLTDKEIGKRREIPCIAMIIFRERTKATEELKRIMIKNYLLGLGSNPDPMH